MVWLATAFNALFSRIALVSTQLAHWALDGSCAPGGSVAKCAGGGAVAAAGAGLEAAVGVELATGVGGVVGVSAGLAALGASGVRL